MERNLTPLQLLEMPTKVYDPNIFNDYRGLVEGKKVDSPYTKSSLHRIHVVTVVLARAVLESSNLIVGIDFTKSNEWGLDMEHVSNNAYGAFGYLDLEYKQGFLNEKSNIYSFGVVLFEIVCGRLAWLVDCKDHSQSLGPLAKRKYQEGKIDELVFDGIKEQIAPESMPTFAEIAYKCLNDKREERPVAGDVLIQLKKVLDVQVQAGIVFGLKVSNSYEMMDMHPWKAASSDDMPMLKYHQM